MVTARTQPSQVTLPPVEVIHNAWLSVLLMMSSIISRSLIPTRVTLRNSSGKCPGVSLSTLPLSLSLKADMAQRWRSLTMPSRVSGLSMFGMEPNQVVNRARLTSALTLPRRRRTKRKKRRRNQRPTLPSQPSRNLNMDLRLSISKSNYQQITLHQRMRDVAVLLSPLGIWLTTLVHISSTRVCSAMNKTRAIVLSVLVTAVTPSALLAHLLTHLK